MKNKVIKSILRRGVAEDADRRNCNIPNPWARYRITQRHKTFQRIISGISRPVILEKTSRRSEVERTQITGGYT